MVFRLRPWFLTVSMTSVGCSAAHPTQPEWPHHPSPSYPGSMGQPEDAPVSKTESPKAADDVVGATTLAKQYRGKEALDTLEGKATYYADSLAGNHTANGDVYDPSEFTAAHKKLPFGTIVRVIRTDTKATTYVKINDRGPFGPADRIIDLSKAAAKQLGMMKAGVVSVRVEVVERPKK